MSSSLLRVHDSQRAIPSDQNTRRHQGVLGGEATESYYTGSAVGPFGGFYYMVIKCAEVGRIKSMHRRPPIYITDSGFRLYCLSHLVNIRYTVPQPVTSDILTRSFSEQVSGCALSHLFPPPKLPDSSSLGILCRSSLVQQSFIGEVLGHRLAGSEPQGDGCEGHGVLTAPEQVLGGELVVVAHMHSGQLLAHQLPPCCNAMP